MVFLKGYLLRVYYRYILFVLLANLGFNFFGWELKMCFIRVIMSYTGAVYVRVFVS